MQNRLRIATLARWRGWAILGLVVTLSFLAHDLGMVSLAPGSEFRFIPTAGSTVSTQVTHVAGAGGREATHAITPHQHRADEDGPAQSACEITWAAIPTVNETLAATMHAMPNQIEPTMLWRGDRRSPGVTDTAVLSARDQRALFQVFLI